ncbi:Hypp6020 [Branchiostoma lanceolatum]|uniref:Hypp6020 protein n=1 Tax=Branchiostoma lanceolatum TaxID=7740 RepID=A0A8J9VI92_BRALA|nr:Hypp6020 [Branchiostoma lanceolatum]
MVRVNNCCGCCDLKSGTISISIVYLVLAILNMILGIMGVVGAKGAAMYVGVAIDGIMIILCILLIIGAMQDNHILCMVWVVGAIVWSVLLTIMAIVASVLIGLLANAAEDIQPTDQPDVPAAAVGAAIGVALGIMWGIVAVEVTLVIYSAIVVYSHAQNLREGGGSPPPYSHFGGPKI